MHACHHPQRSAGDPEFELAYNCISTITERYRAMRFTYSEIEFTPMR
jgi:hypothetical protein